MPQDHTKGARRLTRRVLSLKETLALNKLVIERYAASGMNNASFAQDISTDPTTAQLFRFPLSDSHIATALAGADIPPNKPRYAQGAPDASYEALRARVASLEEQVAALSKLLPLARP